MANEDKTSVLYRTDFRTRKHIMKALSNDFRANEQTSSIAFSLWRRFRDGNANWVREEDLTSNLVPHDYKMNHEDILGDAYGQICDFGRSQKEGEQNTFSPRKIQLGMACYTICLPDEIIDTSLNGADPDTGINADLDTLTMTVYGDLWLAYGCYVVVALSDSEHPPEYSAIMQRMENSSQYERKGNDCYAGYIGESPTSSDVVRYLRSDVICATAHQSNTISNRQGEAQGLAFHLHSWGIDDIDEDTGLYKIKPYIHIIVFLDKTQYTTDRSYMIEGSACVNLDSVVLTTTSPVNRPVFDTAICALDSLQQKATDMHSGDKFINLQGKVFSLVNTFSMLDSQTSNLSKKNAQVCVWSAIESAIERIETPNAIYGFGDYPPITLKGFDFYTVGVDGTEYVRIGCVDENAMDFDNDTAAPSVYSAIVGYPVNPGFNKVVYERMTFQHGVGAFSGCMTVKVVIYQALHDDSYGRDGGSYGYGALVDKKSFNAHEFFDGTSEKLTLFTGENLTLLPLYSAMHSHFSGKLEIQFNNLATFESAGLLIVGIAPMSFTKENTLTNDGDWLPYENPVYKSQYMQLVEWPISQSVTVYESL